MAWSITLGAKTLMDMSHGEYFIGKYMHVPDYRCIYTMSCIFYRIFY